MNWWTIPLMVLAYVLGIGYVASRLLKRSFVMGYFVGRADERTVTIRAAQGEYESDYDLLLDIRNQIAEVIGETEAQEWASHIEFKLELATE